jgi:methyltransferase (TIGR00027 family)
VAEGTIANVSDTAFWIAHYRALETERADALFRDPLAGLLSGEHGKQIAHAMPRRFMTAWFVAIRTRIIDDYIQLGVSQGVDTVLNLGAGLDTRPYRMDLPQNLLWLEVDYPATIEFKEKRLASEKPRCRLERVKLDLGNLPERKQMFESMQARSKKMLILTEGVIPYLSVEQAGSLADDLHKLNSAYYWITDYFAPQIFKYRKRMMRGKLQNAPFQFNPPDWQGFFATHGWRAKEIRYLAEEGERLKRPLQLPPILKTLFVLRGLLSSAQKRAEYRRFAGYALLERLEA